MVRGALASFLAECESEGRSLPRFVVRELERYLECGLLPHGFLRVICQDCKEEQLVAFSCKGRGFCPSCCTRRMYDAEAQLTERVLPAAPYRQWVLTYPFRLRLALAMDREAGAASQRLFLSEVFRWQRREARARGVRGPQPGAIGCTQRFGGRLNLNLHHHAILPDGVFVEEGAAVRLEELPAPSPAQLAAILQRIVRRTQQLAKARGLLDREREGPLPELQAESVQGSLPLRLAPRPPRKGRLAEQDGYTLEAGVHLHRNDREGLGRLCRYLLRPPLSLARLSETADGQVQLKLRRPWADGTAAVTFSRMTLVRRLAALVPPPRAHQLRYHGVFAPAARLRSRVVPAAPPQGRRCVPAAPDAPEKEGAPRAAGRIPWAELLQRVWGLDVLCCPCGGRRAVVAFIESQTTARRLLEHLGLPSTGPPRAPARVPAWQQDLLELPGDDHCRDVQHPEDGAQSPAPEEQ